MIVFGSKQKGHATTLRGVSFLLERWGAYMIHVSSLAYRRRKNVAVPSVGCFGGIGKLHFPCDLNRITDSAKLSCSPRGWGTASCSILTSDFL
ncbi:MAG: hypothetical protein UY23_C0001G0034 [Candidatus Jorgensenbacteria bacterium GW2011_GWA1_48_11]|uniref:Uncharacterized protein n=1 Tax=Candidatus Jorgensenbacteria bacterium GW2011_GWA1_48_11 TaxID=1618660 RepID=A0A0G1WM63_9BACT|nr:MAG: hypothetical protein UY23_C0001G0034 [Candidatus Jorgensenbacteria bacterium GW2011_GWA1_48_11]KKW11923.1 MAG: hypothetical protein UY51_C0005G0165 [Candidatus Jorgensenbacteria bacterium GW2011_GWB1_49_9]